MEKATDEMEKKPDNGDETSVLRETVLVKSEVSNEQVFENLNIKVEPASVKSEDDPQESETVVCEEDKDNHDSGKKEKIPIDRAVAMSEKTKLPVKSNSCKSSGDHSSDDSKQDESGSSPKTEVEETPEERRRRLARERMRRKRASTREKEQLMATKKQRIEKQKLKLIQRLKYREEKRKSRQRLRDLSESSQDDDSNRSLNTSDGDATYEIPIEHHQHSESNGSNSNSDETEEEKELKLPQKQQSGQCIEVPIGVDGGVETERKNQMTQNDKKDVSFNKKRAPGDIEYLYFYENSQERRKRLNWDRHTAQYRARKRMDLEEECDVTTSRRYLEFD